MSTIASRRPRFRRVLDDAPPGAPPPRIPAPAEDDELDAYSRAVTTVVERVGPAVVSLAVSPRRAGLRAGSGSGVLFTPDGYALTNAHVVRGGKRLRASFTDGSSHDAAVVGADDATDLAVVRIDGGRLPYAELGRSATLRVGQLVVAIGNPLGFSSSVSAGVLSARGRTMRAANGRLMANNVQSVGALHPVSSGGPLVDGRARVVAINTAMILGAQGISFAVPIDTAKEALGQLMAIGRVRRGWLGVAGQDRPLDRGVARRLGLVHASGVEVVRVEPDGPAATAGIAQGDVLVAFAGQPTRSIDDLHRALNRWPIEGPVEIRVLREGTIETLSVSPREAR